MIRTINTTQNKGGQEMTMRRYYYLYTEIGTQMVYGTFEEVFEQYGHISYDIVEA
jgi:hypothetical protein